MTKLPDQKTYPIRLCKPGCPNEYCGHCSIVHCMIVFNMVFRSVDSDGPNFLNTLK